jgi:hypothetical protein
MTAVDLERSNYYLARCIARAVQVLALILGAGLFVLGLLGVIAGKQSAPIGVQMILTALFLCPLVYVICSAIAALFDIADLTTERDLRDRREIERKSDVERKARLNQQAQVGVDVAPGPSPIDQQRKPLTEADIERLEREQRSRGK